MTAGRLIFNFQFTFAKQRQATLTIFNKFSILKFSLLLLLTTYFLLLTTNPVSAQTASSSSQTPPSLPAVASAKEGLLTTNYAYSQGPHTASLAIYNFSHAMSCILIGQSPIAPCLEYKMVKDATGMVKSYPILSSVNTTGGFLGMGSSALALLYIEKPLDQMSFFTYLGRNLGVVKEANAQVGGSGNQVLSPIFALWTVSRNFSYIIMILIFIGVGLMVMFRQKLNPQTVVSVQMALPGLVIGLILITFSYFLAALITDTAYVGTDLVGYYFDEAIKVSGGSPGTESLTQKLANESAVSIGAGSVNILDHGTLQKFLKQIYDKLPLNTTAAIDPRGVLDPTKSITPRNVISLFSSAITYMIYNSLLSPVFDITGGALGTIGGIIAKMPGGAGAATGAATALSKVANAFGAAGATAGGLGTVAAAGWGIAAFNDPVGYLSFWASILAILIMLYTIVKLFFRLITCYLMIIFQTITSPFVFLASSIPGRQNMVTDWMRNMLCNVLSFPAVIGVFYFAAFLLGNNEVPGFKVTSQLNLTNATGNLPFLGGLDLGILRKILAFGAILMTPSIPDVICKTVGKPGQSGAMLGGAIGGAIGAGRQYQGQISGQLQGAGRDISSWKQALWGRREYTGGRLGAIESRLHAIDDPTYLTSVGTPKTGTGVVGWLNARLSDIRGAQPATLPQNPAQLEGGLRAKAQKRGGYGGPG